MKTSGFASTDRRFRNIPPKKVAEKFATVFWYYELQRQLNLNTPADVQRAIEEVGDRGVVGVRRRWRDYKSGHHKPVTSVVELAEQQVPGSKAILQSPLWSAMRLDKSAIKVAQQLLGKTTKEGDELLEWLLDRQQTSKVDRWLRKRCMAMVFHATLESLAVLTVCMRLARSKGMPHWTLTFYHFATDSLMILGSWFYQHGIAQASAEYYEKVLLPTCYGKNASWLFSSRDYFYIVRAMAREALNVQEQAGRNLTHNEIVSAMLKLLDE
ncbi:hypothetical protein [Aquitalea sp.]|uniref:hypothetical protein n=1 Tax=Aquitalea sp. TaxID=1872623 RepID=UPI0025834A06|nr:hypothetical protein [Aquitalea sp.]